MTLRYVVLQKSDAWALFRGDVELASFSAFEQAVSRARSVALVMSSEVGPVQLLLQDRFGELTPEWFESRAITSAEGQKTVAPALKEAKARLRSYL